MRAAMLVLDWGVGAEDAAGDGELEDGVDFEVAHDLLEGVVVAELGYVNLVVVDHIADVGCLLDLHAEFPHEIDTAFGAGASGAYSEIVAELTFQKGCLFPERKNL